jgi:hypothetical protein
MGKNYIEPIAFFKALIAKEAAIATASVVATDDDPVAPAPEHNEAQAAVVEAERVAAKVTPAPVAAPAAPKAEVPPAPKVAVVVPKTKPAIKGELKIGSKGPAVAYLQSKLNVPITGVFDRATHVATIGFQQKHKEITLKDGIVGPITWSKLG